MHPSSKSPAGKCTPAGDFRVSEKWFSPLFRESKFGQPEVARICKELILQAKSTTQQGAVFPQGKTAVAKRLGFSFEKPTVRRQSRLTRMKVGGAAAPPTPPKVFLTVWRAPVPCGTGARLPFQAEPQKKSLSLPWPAKAPASMGPEGFQRAIGKPFGRARRRETLPLQKNEKTLCQRSDAPPVPCGTRGASASCQHLAVRGQGNHLEGNVLAALLQGSGRRPLDAPTAGHFHAHHR